jgi:hypothetical protein
LRAKRNWCEALDGSAGNGVGGQTRRVGMVGGTCIIRSRCINALLSVG